MNQNSRTLQHFRYELSILQAETKDDEDGLIIKDYIDIIERIIEIFESQGHSGFSASCYASVLSKTIKNVLMHKTLSPLTGKEHEWNNVSDMNGCHTLYQNNRDSSVFKDEADNAHYLDAIVFQGEDDFDSFTGSVGGIYSSQYIKSFPFTPKRFTVHVYRELYDENNPKHKTCSDIVECGLGTFAYFIKDPTELEAVAEYYDMEKTKLMRNKINEK